MRKILPLNVDVGITTECWTLYRLSAILTNNKYYSWYYERFINLTMVDNCEVVYYPTYFGNYQYRIIENQFIYDEVLNCKLIDYKNKGIVDAIIEGINNGWYSLIDYNRFFIEGDQRYLKENSYHDVIICGYDMKDEVFYCFDYNLRNIQIGIQTIKFDQLEKAFLSSINYHRKIGEYSQYCENLPATFIRPDNRFEREVCLGRILDTLDNYMNSHNIEIISNGNTLNLRKGISIYKGYYQDLYERLLDNENYFSNNALPLFRIKTVGESKKGILTRMNYLMANKYICFNESELEEKVNEFMNKIELVFSIMSKFYYTHDKSLLMRTNEIWHQIENLDENFTCECINIIRRCI